MYSCHACHVLSALNINLQNVQLPCVAKVLHDGGKLINAGAGVVHSSQAIGVEVNTPPLRLHHTCRQVCSVLYGYVRRQLRRNRNAPDMSANMVTK